MGASANPDMWRAAGSPQRTGEGRKAAYRYRRGKARFAHIAGGRGRLGECVLSAAFLPSPLAPMRQGGAGADVSSALARRARLRNIMVQLAPRRQWTLRRNGATLHFRRLGQNDYFSSCGILLHAAMRFRYIVETKDTPDLNMHSPQRRSDARDRREGSRIKSSEPPE